MSIGYYVVHTSIQLEIRTF